MRRTLILVTALALSLSSTAYELNAKGLKEGTAGNFDEASSNFSKAIEAAKDSHAVCAFKMHNRYLYFDNRELMITNASSPGELAVLFYRKYRYEKL